MPWLVVPENMGPNLITYPRIKAVWWKGIHRGLKIPRLRDYEFKSRRQYHAPVAQSAEAAVLETVYCASSNLARSTKQ